MDWPPSMPPRPARAAAQGSVRLPFRPRRVVGGAVGLVGLAALLAAVLLTGGRANSSLQTNPELEPGQPLYPRRPAPNFTLTSQFGQKVSLSQFRGRVVALAFVDPRCLGVCPLTTNELASAKQELGRAAGQVQLLGVAANPEAHSVGDVRAYSAYHGLLHKWLFLTGSLAELKAVWHDYGIEARVIHGLVDHTPALYLINQAGELVRVYVTPMYYTAVYKQAQLLAEDLAALLPGHPRVERRLSYAQLPPIQASEKVTLPLYDGGRIALGASGRPHLLLFFGSWVEEVENLAGELDGLNRYAARAKAQGLPSPVAVDLWTSEPSPTALSQLVRTLPQPLAYPLAIDRSGRLADHYGIEEAPWLVLTSASGQVLWYADVAATGWVPLGVLEQTVRAALRKTAAPPPASADLAGSPPPLAALHNEASRLLPGGAKALQTRLASLKGFPVVVNIWASWCRPCQKEMPLLGQASLRYGRRIAFLGAAVEDPAGAARSFLSAHPVFYPSYETTLAELEGLAPITGVPDTLYFSPGGRLVHLQIGEYPTAAALQSDLERYAG